MELQKELVRLCAVLNRRGVKYVVVGGCAVILHGYYRTTHDIDLIVEPSPENIQKIKESLYEIFGSQEIFEMGDDDVIQCTVVRFTPFSQDIAIDLMGRIGKIAFKEACKDIEEVEIEGVMIPLSGLSTLIETKKGIRPKDKEDFLFLIGKKEYLEKGGDRK